MITKEQALTSRYFIMLCDGSRWRANGKCKTWRTRPEEFKLPVKHGLYSFGYITHENAHLFDVVD